MNWTTRVRWKVQATHGGEDCPEIAGVTTIGDYGSLVEVKPCIEYFTGELGVNACPTDAMEIESEDECRNAQMVLGVAWNSVEDDPTHIGGCRVGTSGNVNWNKNTGSAHSGHRKVCK